MLASTVSLCEHVFYVGSQHESQPKKGGSSKGFDCARAGSMQVRKLKLLCERLFRLPAAQQALRVPDQDGQPCSNGAIEDDKELAALDLQVSKRGRLLKPKP